MPLDILVKGIIIGLAVAVPVGPIGILCIRRTLAHSRKAGFYTGLGAATADFIYGTIAAFSITVVSDFLMKHQLWFSLIGGIILLYVGLTTVMMKSAPPVPPADALPAMTSLVGDYISGLILTITNPATVISFVAVFAGFGLKTGGNYSAASLLAAGVFIGSATWWLILSSGTALFKHKVSQASINGINKISGAFIAGFGLFALVNILR